MKFYMAPMEGVTGYIYRNAYQSYFGHVEKYFAPFIVASEHRTMSKREINDILPENNAGLTLIPQILTNKAADFISTAEGIRKIGYKEINLNLGCPSGTVVAKGKGAGFLARQDELDSFLEEVFAKTSVKVSIKTRIGKVDPEEFYELIEIFNRYPIEELTIHPRIQTDYYKNKPNWKVFKDALTLSKNPLCYNGDIFTIEEYENFRKEFPSVESIMLGRGLIRNPFLIAHILNNAEFDSIKFKLFHDRIFEGYKKILFGDRNILFKMKELWVYMIQLFPDSHKELKQIKKSQRLSDYEIAVAALFRK